MQTLQLKPQHQGSVIDQILKMKALTEYYYNQVAPNISKMQKWEAKEYMSAHSENVAELERLEKYIIEHEMLFNAILFEYHYTVVTFLAKFIK